MKILFLGDFFFDYDHIPDDIYRIGEFIQKNDLNVVLNLESSLDNSDNPIQKRGPNLCSSILTLDVLKHLNVIAVCLANNHTMDFGKTGLQNTMRMLREAGIPYLGAGMNIREASAPLFIDNNKVALQNFAWDIEEAVYARKNDVGVAPLNRDAILKQTRDLKQKNTRTVINIYHWGFEYNLLPMPFDIKFAHDSIDNGADLIVGGHPHVLQPSEVYKGKSVFYSLGNFYFSSRRKLFNKCFANYPVKNASDFGLGVIFDTDTLKCENNIIQYHSDDDSSYLKPFVKELVSDLSMCNWKSNEYYSLAIRCSNNFTPILTDSAFMNYIRLTSLKFKYSIAKSLNFLKRYKLGRAFFEWAKRH